MEVGSAVELGTILAVGDRRSLDFGLLGLGLELRQGALPLCPLGQGSEDGKLEINTVLTMARTFAGYLEL